ncbi:MAG: hypothetical protein V3T19_07530 [Acidiferrobacterales bacterium]
MLQSNYRMVESRISTGFPFGFLIATSVPGESLMGKFRNYVFAAAGFVILAGAFTIIGPYVDFGHSKPPPSVSDVNVVNTPAEPVPVVVQNGDAGETMIITLAENLTLDGNMSTSELDAVDTSGFRRAEPSTSSLVTKAQISQGKRLSMITRRN